MNWISPADQLPKNQQRVIVVYEPYHTGKYWRTVAVYIPKMTIPEEDFMDEDYHGNGDWNEDNSQCFTPEGWYEANVEAETNWKINAPKFWQPFPELPFSCA